MELYGIREVTQTEMNIINKRAKGFAAFHGLKIKTFQSPYHQLESIVEGNEKLEKEWTRIFQKVTKTDGVTIYNGVISKYDDDDKGYTVNPIQAVVDLTPYMPKASSFLERVVEMKSNDTHFKATRHVMSEMSCNFRMAKWIVNNAGFLRELLSMPTITGPLAFAVALTNHFYSYELGNTEISKLYRLEKGAK